MISQQEGDGGEHGTRSFFTLYCKITNAEDKHVVSNQKVIRAYYLFGEASLITTKR
jgi:hypothetical protein